MGLMSKVPSLSRCGNRRMPRAWRCLGGWRRAMPGRSRRHGEWWGARDGDRHSGDGVGLPPTKRVGGAQAGEAAAAELRNEPMLVLALHKSVRGELSKTNWSGDSVPLDSSCMPWTENIFRERSQWRMALRVRPSTGLSAQLRSDALVDHALPILEATMLRVVVSTQSICVSSPTPPDAGPHSKGASATGPSPNWARKSSPHRPASTGSRERHSATLISTYRDRLPTSMRCRGSKRPRCRALRRPPNAKSPASSVIPAPSPGLR